jgi:hypothetical protein
MQSKITQSFKSVAKLAHLAQAGRASQAYRRWSFMFSCISCMMNTFALGAV